MDIEAIAALVIPDSGVEFKGEDVRRFQKPCVYVYLNEDTAIYVGSSRKGIERAISSNHHKIDASAQCTKLLVYFCENWGKALECEKLLISYLQPSMNGRNKDYYVSKLLGIRNMCKTEST